MLCIKKIETVIKHPSEREIARQEQSARECKAAINGVRFGKRKQPAMIRESAWDRSHRIR